MKKLLTILVSLGVLALAVTTASAQEKEKKGKKAKSAPAAMNASETKPKTVIHVVTVSWKADAKPEQIQAALDAAHKLPSAFPGVLRVWTKTLKAQGERTHAIVMEFKDEQALKDYAGSDAQTAWYKPYQEAREASTTFDISN